MTDPLEAGLRADSTADPTDPADPTDTAASEDPAPDEPTRALPASRGESVAAAVGSFMAGIEQQVFQRRPPSVELVQEATPLRGTTGDGIQITLELPDPIDQER